MSGLATQPIIDAHQHFWDLDLNYYPWLSDEPQIPFRYGDYGALRRDYLPADYRADSEHFQIAGTVHVEAEFDPANPVAETDWLQELADEHGLPTACVAQAKLGEPYVAEVLAAQAGRRLVRGVRHKPRAAATPAEARRGLPGSMDDPAWRRGFAMLARYGLSFDLQTPWWHLEQAAELAADFPHIQIILNHTGLPSDRSPEGLAGWRAALECAAQAPNIALKISGLGLPGRRWDRVSNIAVIRDAITIFGAQRCMFASNYPVDSLVASFRAIVEAFMEAIADRPEGARHQLLYGNAVRLYRLDQSQLVG